MKLNTKQGREWANLLGSILQKFNIIIAKTPKIQRGLTNQMKELTN